jgi:hypothetical protein
VQDSNIDQIISSAAKGGRAVLSEIDSKRVLAAMGLPVVVPEVA